MYIRKTIILCKSIARGFTLAKFLSGLFTIIIVALMKYNISGNILENIKKVTKCLRSEKLIEM